MQRGLVITLEGNIASVMLDDEEVIDIEVGGGVCVGDEIPVSGEMIETASHPNVWDDEPENEPSFEW